MATVYAAPVPAPDFMDFLGGRGSFDNAGYAQATEAYFTELRTWLREHGYHHKLTGKIIRLPWADGAAQYMIMNGTKIIHLPLDDAWQVPDYQTRGLRATDLARMASDN